MTTMQGHQALTDLWVRTAVEFSASKAFGGDVERTRKALSQGHCEVCDYVRHNLALRVGGYLGQTDPTVKAVYLFETEEQVEFGDSDLPTLPAGISLIAWVDRKTAALAALTKALESSLAESRRALGCVKARPMCFYLDVHVVDDVDVQERRGYGALVNSVHVEPMRVWARAH